MVSHGLVVAVCSDDAHRFSKPVRPVIRLVKDHGVENDAHAGAFVAHRYLAKRMPQQPNDRQVHLIQSELFDDVRALGFIVTPGALGENVTTRGIDLLTLPRGSLLSLGLSAVVELTGLRTPCGYIDKFQKGLKRAMIVRSEGGPAFRAGVLGVVRASGDLSSGDPVRATLPPKPWQPLPAI